MKQKGEIELQNIEITDSINYAKRIQTSILPDINKLKESFKDAFILFHPRDIVSGDFYWFDKLEDDKFILVCADSTGHGVPGAFMSMIGSTLLQDIVTRKRISKPSEILSLLDKQIFPHLIRMWNWESQMTVWIWWFVSLVFQHAISDLHLLCDLLFLSSMVNHFI